MPANAPFTKIFTQGDTLTAISDALVNPDGSPYDLTGVSVAFRMINQVTKSVVVNNAAATIVSAAGGIVSYTFQAADVSTVGSYWGWWLVTFAGAIEHFPGDGEKMTVRIVPSE